MQRHYIKTTTKFIKIIALMKGEELMLCKKKIKMLEKILKDDYRTINVYKYKQANERLDKLKSIIFDLKMLELKIKRKF